MNRFEEDDSVKRAQEERTARVYLQQDFSQRANHVKSSILFPGVTCGISEDLVAESHGLLQYLHATREENGFT